MSVRHPGGAVRAVVTGCAGFIGSHLAQRLLVEGWSVRGVDAVTPYYDVVEKEANLALLGSSPDFALVRADLATASLERLVEDADVVVHLAAQPGVRASFGAGFARCDRDNVLATQRLLDASATTGCRRVVMASSSSVYGEAAVAPTPEEAPLRPRSPYGVTKRTCEDLAGVYRELGLDVVALRYFTVYGPRQRPDMAIRRLCEAVSGGPPFELYGADGHVRDFTHVDDAVAATVTAMTAPAPPEVLNVGGGQAAAMADVVDVIGELAGVPVPVRRCGPRDGDVRRTGADTSRLRALGWRPDVDLVDGLRDELAWVRRRRGGVLPALVGRAS